MPDRQPPKPTLLAGYAGMDIAALRRYVAGECTPEEHQRVEVWAAESPARRRYLNALTTLYRRVPAEEARSATTAWAKIVAAMVPVRAMDDAAYKAPWEEPAARIHVRRPQRARILMGAFATGGTRWRLLFAAAAAVAITLTGVKATLGTRAHAAPPHIAAMRQIITAKGQRAEIQLEDGSRVMLGVASRLQLPSDFGIRRRDVYLDGTAYFDVVHDSLHPFAVHTANAVARDVGTRFVVSAYPESRSTRVVVRDGSVTLGSAQTGAGLRAASVLLTGGQLGHLRFGDTAATTQTVDPALYTAWIRGDLVFHDVPLSEAVAELRRWYDVDLEIGDASLRNMPISAKFAVQSFHEALSVVTTVLPLRAVRRGNVVTLYRRKQ